MALSGGFLYCSATFSSKEERRRIVASVVDPLFLAMRSIGLENHLNVFHNNKEPLSEALAKGWPFSSTQPLLMITSGGSAVTQVNASLKLIKYPSRNTLIELGKWADKQGELTQDMIDKKLERIAE